MQRVRIGLTGLAFVFVAVLLAAVFTSHPHDEQPLTPNTLEHQSAGPSSAAANADQPRDPLAPLGLAPGNPAANGVAPAPAAPHQ